MEDRLDKSENGSTATKILFWGRGAGTISVAFLVVFSFCAQIKKKSFLELGIVRLFTLFLNFFLWVSFTTIV